MWTRLTLGSSELNRADPESHAGLIDLGSLSDSTDLAPVLGQVAGSRERAFDDRSSSEIGVFGVGKWYALPLHTQSWTTQHIHLVYTVTTRLIHLWPWECKIKRWDTDVHPLQLWTLPKIHSSNIKMWLQDKSFLYDAIGSYGAEPDKKGTTMGIICPYQRWNA